MSFKNIKTNIKNKLGTIKKAVWINSRENKDKADAFLNNACKRLRKMGYRAKPYKRSAVWWKWQINTNAPREVQNDVIDDLKDEIGNVMEGE